MKKLLVVFLSIFLMTSSGYAYSVYFTVQGSNLGELNGFQFNASGTAVSGLTLDIVYQNEPNVIGFPGAVPAALSSTYPWDIGKTSTGVLAFDNSFGGSPLTAGVVLSLTGTSSFSLIDFVFARNAGSGGAFDLPYSLIESAITDGKVYAFSSPAAAVPIPAAVWLLGSGVVGLVALKRRKKA